MRVSSDSQLPETYEETDDISTLNFTQILHIRNSSEFDQSTIGCNLCSPPNKHHLDASSTASDGEFHPPATCWSRLDDIEHLALGNTFFSFLLQQVTAEEQSASLSLTPVLRQIISNAEKKKCPALTYKAFQRC